MLNQTYLLYSNITNNMKSTAPKPITANKGRQPDFFFPVWSCLVRAVGPNSFNLKFLVNETKNIFNFIEYFEKELLENF